MSHEAVFTGSFDPITLGHVEIIKKSLGLFDKLHIVVAETPKKTSRFSSQEKMDLIQSSLRECGVDCERCVCHIYAGFIVDFCSENKIEYLIRGLRNTLDFEYENTMGQINSKLNQSVETVYFMTSPEMKFVSSTAAKEIAHFGGELKDFVPAQVAQGLRKDIQRK